MNKTGKKRVPVNAPLEFISNRWKKHVFEQEGSINRHYYEMAAFTELKNRIRSGDIAVEGCHNYKSFDEYVIPAEEWKTKRDISSKIAVSSFFVDYLQKRKESLHVRYQWLSDNIHQLDGIDIKNKKVRVDKLEKETPDETIYLSEKIYKMLSGDELRAEIIYLSLICGVFLSVYKWVVTKGSIEKPIEEKIEELKEVQEKLKRLDKYLESLKQSLAEQSKSLSKLKEENKALKPIIEADKNLINGIFAVQNKIQKRKIK